MKKKAHKRANKEDLLNREEFFSCFKLHKKALIGKEKNLIFESEWLFFSLFLNIKDLKKMFMFAQNRLFIKQQRYMLCH